MAFSIDIQSLSESSGSPLAALTQIAIALDALACGAMLLGRRGTVAHANPKLCALLGIPREKLVGSDLLSVYESDEDARRFIRESLAEFDRPMTAEFFLPQLDGKRLPIVLASRTVGREPPLCDYAVITLIDISAQKLAEESLREQFHIVAKLSDTVMEQALKLKDHADTLELRVKQRTAELHEAHLETIYILAIASEAKDQDTGHHVRRLQQHTEALAKMLDVPPSEAERLGLSAVLHDVGKIHTPDIILKKPGPLTPVERAHMMQHTIAGEHILSPSPYFNQAARIARSHHENWDGSGYPDQSAGADIPYEARIVHVADVYDALTSHRVYKPAWGMDRAAEEIRRAAGILFDPTVVEAFEKLYRSGHFRRVEEEDTTFVSTAMGGAGMTNDEIRMINQ